MLHVWLFTLCLLLLYKFIQNISGAENTFDSLGAMANTRFNGSQRTAVRGVKDWVCVDQNIDQWLFIIMALINIKVLCEKGSITASGANECIAVGTLPHGIRKYCVFQILSAHHNQCYTQTV
jgi:hypothetical protein